MNLLYRKLPFFIIYIAIFNSISCNLDGPYSDAYRAARAREILPHLIIAGANIGRQPPQCKYNDGHLWFGARVTNNSLVAFTDIVLRLKFTDGSVIVSSEDIDIYAPDWAGFPFPIGESRDVCQRVTRPARWTNFSYTVSEFHGSNW